MSALIGLQMSNPSTRLLASPLVQMSWQVQARRASTNAGIHTLASAPVRARAFICVANVSEISLDQVIF